MIMKTQILRRKQAMRKVIKRKPTANNVKALDKSLPFSQLVMTCVTEFFRDSEQNRYCIFTSQYEPKMLLDINSSDFDEALTRLHYKIYGSFVKKAEKSAIIEGINALAANATVKSVGTRLLQLPDKLVYNLGEGKVVVVTSEDISIHDNVDCDYYFVSQADMPIQTTPDLSCDEAELIPLLKELFVVSDDDCLLLAVYICTLFVKDIHHPILTAYGDIGASKTTTLKTIAKIIDPSNRELLYLNQTSPKDFQTALTKNYFTVFDNVTGSLSDSIMNMLCQVVTGGTLSMRKLFTTNDEVKVSLQRCLAMSGTDVIGKRNDLLERSLLIKFNRLPADKRINDSSYEQKFVKLRPKILGAIFKVLSKTLALHARDSFELSLDSRMLEWAQWGYCIAESLETGLGKDFCDSYQRNLKSSNTVSISGNPYISSIVDFIGENGSWIGSSTEFFDEIHSYASEKGYDVRNKCFPTCVTQVWQKMKLYKPNLKELGISIYEPVNTGRYRELKIIKNS